MCSILNLNLNNEEANTLSEKICSLINKSEKQVEFKFMNSISTAKQFYNNLGVSFRSFQSLQVGCFALPLSLHSGKFLAQLKTFPNAFGGAPYPNAKKFEQIGRYGCFEMDASMKWKLGNKILYDTYLKWYYGMNGKDKKKIIYLASSFQSAYRYFF